MRPLLLLAGLSALLAAQDLRSLLDAADRSELVQARERHVDAAQYGYESARASYLPRVDLGASATYLDNLGAIDVRETYTAYAKASVVLFDGFRREHLLDEKRADTGAREADLAAYKKSLSLQIARNYFELLARYGELDAQTQRRTLLGEELERQQRFYDAGIATEEELERIKAAKADADLAIETVRYDIDRIASELSTLTALDVGRPEPSRFEAHLEIETLEPDAIRSLRREAEALDAQARQSTASHYPSLSVEDTYSFYDYEGASSEFPIERVDRQNRLMAVVSMNLLDFSSASKTAQALQAQRQALMGQIAYECRRAQAEVALARRAIERSEAQIRAAELSLTASTKAFETVREKYEARIADYVAYLDALYQKTDAQAQLIRARSTLQSAYAQFYHAAGHSLKEYLK